MDKSENRASHAWHGFHLLIRVPKYCRDGNIYKGPVPERQAHDIGERVSTEIALRFAGMVSHVVVVPALYPLIQCISGSGALLNSLQSLAKASYSLAPSAYCTYNMLYPKGRSTQGDHAIGLLPDEQYMYQGLDDLFVLPVFCCSKKDIGKLVLQYANEFPDHRAAVTVLNTVQTYFQLPRVEQCDFVTPAELFVTPGVKLNNGIVSSIMLDVYGGTKSWHPNITPNGMPLYYDGQSVNMVFYGIDAFRRQTPAKSYAAYIQEFVYYKSLFQYLLGCPVAVHIAREAQLHMINAGEFTQLTRWLDQNLPVKDEFYREKIQLIDFMEVRPVELLVTPQTVTFLSTNNKETIAYVVFIRTAKGTLLHVENIYSLASLKPERSLEILQQEACQLGLKLNVTEEVSAETIRVPPVGYQPQHRSAMSLVH